LDIESILNSVDFIYRRDCGIGYTLTTIIVRTTTPQPYTSTNPGTLLSQFQSEWNTNQTAIVRDVAHLFTGKNILAASGGVIGIAYLPGVCTATDGYGLSQSHWSSTITIAQRVGLTAHELGHNWGAEHCNQGPDPAEPCIPTPDCAIMCS